MASEGNERRLSINSDNNDTPPSKKRRDSTDSYANNRKIIKIEKKRRSSDVASDRDKRTGSSSSSIKDKNDRDPKSPYKVDSDKDKYSGSRSSKGEKNYRDPKSPNPGDSKQISDDNYTRSRSSKNDTISSDTKSPERGNPHSAYKVDSDKDKYSGSRSSKGDKNYRDGKSPKPGDSKRTSDDKYSRSRSLKNDTISHDRDAKSPERQDPESASKADSEKDKYSGSRSSKGEKNYRDAKSPNQEESKRTSDDKYSRSRSLKNDTIIRDAKSPERQDPESASKADSEKDKYSGSRSSKGEKNYRDAKSPNPEESKRTYSRSRSLKNDTISRDAKSPERENPGSARKSSNKIQDNNKIDSEGNPVIPARHRRTVDLLTSKTGGAYIPPAKLRMMQAEITDKSSVSYQRIAWEALKKSIHGFINKVNVDNIGKITRELLKENIVRGRGLLSKSIIQAQAASPTFTHVYASLVSIINSKFPNIGELLLKRLIIQFKRGFRRNDKNICLSSSRFIAHLVNQRVAHEILALEILTLLVETPTDDSVEVAISFLKECGQKLTEVTSKGINAIFEMLKNILHEGKLDKRVQYMIEVMFQIRKDGFKDHPSIITLLELVEEDDQFTHLIMLDDVTDGQDILNVFKFDDEFLKNEEKYKNLSQELLGSDSDDSSNSSDTNSDSDSDSEDAEKNENAENVIIDNTETNLIALRRTIYLTIHSSLDYEECAHKLMKMELKPGQEMELCHMFLDCCAEQRTYEKFYGLLAQRFCMINKIYVSPFEEIFKDTYQTTHRLDTNRLRNVSKFFAHLLFTDAVSWDVMDCIQLNEDDTTSSSRIFIKILFQELAEYMGLSKLNSRLKDPTLQETFSGLFPRDNPKNTRFAINFFTSIGLGGLTDELREHLKDAPRMPEKTEIINQPSGSSSSSSSSESSSDSETSSNSSTSESSSDEQSKKKRLKEKRKKKSNKTKTNKKKSKIDPNKSTKKKDERLEIKEYKSKGKYREREDYGYSRPQQKRTTSRHRSREDNNSEKRGSKDSKYDKRERYTNYDRY